MAEAVAPAVVTMAPAVVEAVTITPVINVVDPRWVWANDITLLIVFFAPALSLGWYLITLAIEQINGPADAAADVDVPAKAVENGNGYSSMPEGSTTDAAQRQQDQDEENQLHAKALELAKATSTAPAPAPAPAAPAPAPAPAPAHPAPSA